jgi:O-antigen/teichoic acid export membrane protein
MGRSKVVLRLTVIWALAGWGLGVPLTFAIGTHGFALAMSVVSWLSILSVIELNKIVRISFVPQLRRIFLFALIPALVVAGVAHTAQSALEVLALLVAGSAGYVVLMLLGGELEDIRAMLARRRARAAAAPKEAAEHA